MTLVGITEAVRGIPIASTLLYACIRHTAMFAHWHRGRYVVQMIGAAHQKTVTSRTPTSVTVDKKTGGTSSLHRYVRTSIRRWYPLSHHELQNTDPGRYTCFKANEFITPKTYHALLYSTYHRFHPYEHATIAHAHK